MTGSQDEYAFSSSLHSSILMNTKPVQDGEVIEVYDSAESTHMSPYCDLFENFVLTETKEVSTADKKIFHAYGQGEMHIITPNKDRSTVFHLKNVLYTPDTAFTLVSIGHCDHARFSSMFADGKCII